MRIGGIPDYSNVTAYNNVTSFTAPDDGYVESAGNTSGWGTMSLLSNNVVIDSDHNNTAANNVLRFNRGFVEKGVTVSKTGATVNVGYMNFYPLKGKNPPTYYVIKY